MPRKPRPAAEAPRSVSPKAAGALWLWVALFAVTLVVYWPALEGGLVWDDSSHVTKPELQSLHGLWRIWFDLGATQQYYPVLHSAFWIEHRLWGDAVLGYHLVNVVLHALAACLVILIVRKLALPGAWLAGFLFALHPVYVEGVAWISEQKSTLSGLFYLAALLLYLDFDGSRRRRRYFAAIGLFILALLSKSVTATLPAVILVILWWQRGRIAWERDVAPLIPWFGLAVPMGFFTAWVERTLVGANGSDFQIPLLDRVLLAGRATWFYAYKLLWPFDLIFQYPRWKLDSAAWWQYLFPLGVVLVAAGLVWVARRNRGPLAGFLIFTGSLVPVLGFLNVLPFRYSWVADHFQYLASLGLLIPAAAWLSTGAKRFSIQGNGRMALAALLLVVLSVVSWRQSGIYRDEETLYRETLARNGSSWLVHNNLGSLLESKPGALEEAIAQYKAALELEPRYPQTHVNLANALAKLDDPAEVTHAIDEYRAAVRIKPDYAEAHTDLANLLSHFPDRTAEAVAEFREAARLEPGLAQEHANLGSALAQSPAGLPEAIRELETAVQLDPSVAEIHCNLGVALAQSGHLPDAIAQFQAALKINPNLAEAHFLLASGLAGIPARLAEAVAECQTALRIRPDFQPARQLLEELTSGRN